MREIKAKLRISDNAQFAPHLNKWSGSKVESVGRLTEENVDSFIEYMMKNYVSQLLTPAKEEAPANSTEEVF